MDPSVALALAPRAGAGRLLIMAGIGLFILVSFYVWRMRNTFASIPRLEKPWTVLGIGVALLFLAVLLASIEDVIGTARSSLVDLGDGVMAVSAIVILAAMVMMHRAWTVRPVE